MVSGNPGNNADDIYNCNDVDDNSDDIDSDNADDMDDDNYEDDNNDADADADADSEDSNPMVENLVVGSGCRELLPLWLIVINFVEIPHWGRCR